MLDREMPEPIHIVVKDVGLGNDSHPKIDQFVDPAQLRSDINFDPTDIVNAMLETPALYAYYSIIVSRARKQRDAFKLRRDLCRSRVDKATRKKALDNGTKMTEKQVASAVETTASVLLCEDNVLGASEVYEGVNHVLESIKMRRDMLTQVNKVQQNEASYGNALRLKAQDLRDKEKLIGGQK